KDLRIRARKVPAASFLARCSRRRPPATSEFYVSVMIASRMAGWPNFIARQFKKKRVEFLPDHQQSERQPVEFLPDHQQSERPPVESLPDHQQPERPPAGSLLVHRLPRMLQVHCLCAP